MATTPEPPRADRHLAMVLALTAEVLGREVRPEENFFEACGGSLPATDLFIRLENALGIEIDLALFFAARDFRELAAGLADAAALR